MKTILMLIILFCSFNLLGQDVGYLIVMKDSHNKLEKTVLLKEQLAEWLIVNDIKYCFDLTKSPFYESVSTEHYFYIEQGIVQVKKSGKVKFKRNKL